MRTQTYRVNLTQDQRGHLLDIARRGKSSARKVKRSLILCKTDEGLTDQQVSEALLVSPATVYRLRRRPDGIGEGMASALNERPRPGQPRKLNGKQEAHLVAVACSQAPEGHTHWTLQLLADKVVQLEFSDAISLEAVRQILKKTNSNHGRKRSGASRR